MGFFKSQKHLPSNILLEIFTVKKYAWCMVTKKEALSEGV
jgi:hypothetical protein